MKSIGILTSGGDAPGMNAAISSVVRLANSKGIKVIGVTKGYSGLIDGRLAEIDEKDIEGIVGRGGTILKTARCEEMKTKEGQEKALKVLKAFGVEGLVVIGGDGSFKGAQILSHMGMPTVGLPGTIDNDLAYTDYTIGFDTATHYVVNEIAKIRDTMLSHERIGVIEVMGNACGDLALAAGVAGEVEYIIVPEVEFDVDAICDSLVNRHIKGHMTSIVVIAEGAGKGEAFANYIRAKSNLDVKAIVLGYIQRGGAPTAFDRLMSIKMGIKAVELLESGDSNKVVGLHNNKIVAYDIDSALAMKMKFDRKLYDCHSVMMANA